MNVLTDDESWIPYFEPHQKTSNRLWLSTNARRPCFPKRLTSVIKVMYSISFTTKGRAMQVSIRKGKSMNARFYKKKCSEILSNSNRYVDRRWSSVVFICFMTMSQVTRPEV